MTQERGAAGGPLAAGLASWNTCFLLNTGLGKPTCIVDVKLPFRTPLERLFQFWSGNGGTAHPKVTSTSPSPSHAWPVWNPGAVARFERDTAKSATCRSKQINQGVLWNLKISPKNSWKVKTSQFVLSEVLTRLQLVSHFLPCRCHGQSHEVERRHRTWVDLCEGNDITVKQSNLE